MVMTMMMSMNSMRMPSVKAGMMGMGLPRPSINMGMSTRTGSMNDRVVPLKKSRSKQKVGFAPPLFLDSLSSSAPSEGPSVESVLSDLSSLDNKELDEGNKGQDEESVKSSAPWWIMMVIAFLVALGGMAVIAAWRRWDKVGDDDSDREVDDAIRRTSLICPLGSTTESFHREQLSL